MKRTRVAIVIAFASVSLGQTAPVQRPSQVQTKESQAAMTPAAAKERLQHGNRRFVANEMKPRDWSAKVVATASGQYPFAAILGRPAAQIRERSPYLEQQIDAGKVGLVGALYDVSTGEVRFLEN